MYRLSWTALTARELPKPHPKTLVEPQQLFFFNLDTLGNKCTWLKFYNEFKYDEKFIMPPPLYESFI